MSEYEIVFQIRRAEDFGSADGEEIGFGSSCARSDLASAVHAVASMISNGEWEIEPGMPDPADVVAAIRREADQ